MEFASPRWVWVLPCPLTEAARALRLQPQNASLNTNPPNEQEDLCL